MREAMAGDLTVRAPGNQVEVGAAVVVVVDEVRGL
jgi:hypothetical protein